MRSILDKKGLKFNKRGQGGLSITTLVVIIVAIIVLVFLIYGFTTGFGNLWDRITGFFGGGNSNVDSHVTGCQVACSTNSEFTYCGSVRDVKFGRSDARNGEYNCKALEGEGVGLDTCDQYVSDVTCPVIKQLDQQIEYAVSCISISDSVDTSEYCQSQSDWATPDVCISEPNGAEFRVELTSQNIETFIDPVKASEIQRSLTVYEWTVNQQGRPEGQICCLQFVACT